MFAFAGMVLEGRRKKQGRLDPREELEKHSRKPPPAAAKEPGAAASATVAVAGTVAPAQAGTASGVRGSAGGGGSGPSGPGTSTGSRARPSCDNHKLPEVYRAERRVKSILNKLTLEKFDALYAQLLDCCTSAEARAEVVEVIAREVFAKATRQHNFIEMYARVCASLHTDLHRGREVNFKRVLLDQCQQSFTLYLEPPRIDECLDYEAKYEELVKYKTKMLGNVRLIGHLLRLGMLSPKIIFHCTEELLNIGSCEALETLCAFLETLGAAFDTPKWHGQQRLDEVYVRVQHLAEDLKRPARVRCLLKDVLDKRRKHWRE